MNTKLLTRYVKNYFIIITVLLIILIPVYMTIYRKTEEQFSQKTQSQLLERVTEVEEQIDNISIMLSLLSDNEYVKQVASIYELNLPLNSYSLYQTKESLINCQLLKEYTSEMVLVFRKNGIMISRDTTFSNADYYSNKIFGIDDSNFRNYITEGFEDRRSVTYFPEFQNGSILVMVKNYTYYLPHNNIALVFELDEQQINKVLGIDGEYTNLIGCITNADGTLLYQFNYADDVWNPDSLMKNYSLFEINGEISDLNWHLAIPNEVIHNQISHTNLFFSLYLVIAVIGLIIVCVYSYYKSALIIRAHIKEYENIKREATTSSILRLLTVGIYSEKDKQEICHYLPSDFEFYCVVCITTNILSEDESIDCFLSTDCFLDVHFKYLSVNVSSTEKCYIIQMNNNNSSDIGEVAEKLKEFAVCLPDIKIGISTIGVGLDNIRLCYQQAKLMNRQIPENQNLQVFAPSEKAELKKKVTALNLHTRLYDLIFVGEEKSIQELFEKLRSYVKRMPCHTENEVMWFYYEIYTPILRVRDELELNGKVSNFEIQPYQSSQNIHALLDILETASISLCSYAYKDTPKAPRYDVFSFVDENIFNKEMCISYAASAMGLSDKYFAELFKKQCNKNFGAYLEEKRIAHAQKYLLETDMKVNDIAEMVGYSTLDAFYKAFKKNVGLPPGKWKVLASQTHQNKSLSE